MTTLEPLVKLHKLDKVPGLSENICKMITLIKQLNTDKNIQVKLKAKTAFLLAQKSEDKARNKITKDKLDTKKSARELNHVLPAYQQIVKSYENTILFYWLPFDMILAAISLTIKELNKKHHYNAGIPGNPSVV